LIAKFESDEAYVKDLISKAVLLNNKDYVGIRVGLQCEYCKLLSPIHPVVYIKKRKDAAYKQYYTLDQLLTEVHDKLLTILPTHKNCISRALKRKGQDALFNIVSKKSRLYKDKDYLGKNNSTSTIQVKIQATN